ncbi:MAG: hypothetical protein GXY77_11530 [Fibrobacter sp.]|nr:hypothetical protein [Fibrobacter sp.]
MPNLKMLRQPPVYLFVMIGIVLISSASAGWEKIGFAGKEIRALAVGRDVLQERQAVYVPVDDSGVFVAYVSTDSISRSLFGHSPNDRPAGKIHSLLLAENSATMLAGSDSGLYGASLYFASLPTWRKLSLNCTETVTGIAKSDSAFCAVTASGVYRTKSAYGTWLACSLSGAPVRPVSGSVFTAVASWPRGKGFVVGSAAAGAGVQGGPVIFGSVDAGSWTGSTCRAECTCINGSVYSFVADTQITIYAGTSKGVVHGVEFETSCWGVYPPQLEMPIRDMCLARMNSSGMPPDVYAATDSGVYLKSIQTTASGAWNRLFSMKTFAVEVIEENGDPVIYAGTADGLWKYTRSTSVAGRHGVGPNKYAAERTIRYSLDGRVIPPKSAGRYRGVYIAQVTTGSGSRLIRIIAAEH